VPPPRRAGKGRPGHASVIIIGAGIAGLSAGIYARLAGLEATILEHHTRAGGVAAWWRRGQYVIDDGIHFIMDGGGLEAYREVGALGPGSLSRMDGLGRFTDESTGTRIDTTGDLDRLRTDLRGISPGDAAQVDWFIDGAKALRGVDMGLIESFRPPELAGTLDGLWAMWKMRRLLRYLAGRYARPVGDFAGGLRSPVLRDLFRSLFLPEVPVWFIMMTLALLADGRMSLLRTGCRDFIGGMEAKYRSLGGEMVFRSTVERIMVEGGRALGVRLRDGAERRADYVISAADGRSTIFSMLEGKYAGRAVRERYAGWKTVRPLLTVSYGLARTFEGEPHFSFLQLASPLRVAGRPVGALSWRIMDRRGGFCPEGRSVLQAMVETEWGPWKELLEKDISLYEMEKRDAAAAILQTLGRVYPGIGASVELTDVATPCTTWRYTLNHEGAWGGWLITPELVTKSLPITLPGLSGFCMAGQWATPGGSVPGCIVSGKYAVELLLKWEGRRSPPAAPQTPPPALY